MHYSLIKADDDSELNTQLHSIHYSFATSSTEMQYAHQTEQ